MKTVLLTVLSEQEGEYLAAREIEDRLKLGPSGVDGLIRELREDGYGIAGSRAEGYCLEERPDRLLPTEVLPQLTTVALGRQMVYLPTVVSTNDTAKNLARAGTVHGTLVVAETQTGGRGRLGRTWVSPAGGGIWLSLVLRPEMDVSAAPAMTLTTAVGVARSIAAVTGAPARIKWPNDILAGDKKIGGILVETGIAGDHMDYAVVGIGLNVNISQEAFPAELQETATSLQVVLGQKVPRAALLGEMLRELEDWYGVLFRLGFSAVREEWCRLSATLGREVRVSGPAGDINGLAIGLAEDGALLVREASGLGIRVTVGDVSLRYRER